MPDPTPDAEPEGRRGGLPAAQLPVAQLPAAQLPGARQPGAHRPGAHRPGVRPPVSSVGSARGEADAWAAMSLVISGVLVWGGVGALVGAWLHSSLPVLVGLLLGMFGGLYLVWSRYGRA